MRTNKRHLHLLPTFSKFMEITSTTSLAARNSNITQFKISTSAFCGGAEDVDISAVFFEGGHCAGYVLDCYGGDGDAGGWFALWVG